MSQLISDDMVWDQIAARAWCDEGVMRRLRSDPRAVLAEHGMDVPADVAVEVAEGDEVGVEDAGTTLRLTLPFTPPDELTDEDIFGGAFASCFSGVCAVCGACGGCGRCGRCGCRCSCRCF